MGGHGALAVLLLCLVGVRAAEQDCARTEAYCPSLQRCVSVVGIDLLTGPSNVCPDTCSGRSPLHIYCEGQCIESGRSSKQFPPGHPCTFPTTATIWAFGNPPSRWKGKHEGGTLALVSLYSSDHNYTLRVSGIPEIHLGPDLDLEKTKISYNGNVYPTRVEAMRFLRFLWLLQFAMGAEEVNSGLKFRFRYHAVLTLAREDGQEDWSLRQFDVVTTLTCDMLHIIKDSQNKYTTCIDTVRELGCEHPAETIFPQLLLDMAKMRKRAYGGKSKWRPGLSIGDICVRSCDTCPAFLERVEVDECPDDAVVRCENLLRAMGETGACPGNFDARITHSATCDPVMTCRSVKELVARRCVSVVPGGRCERTQWREDCDERGEDFAVLRADETNTTAWCVDPITGLTVPGTEVPYNDRSSLVCTAPLAWGRLSCDHLRVRDERPPGTTCREPGRRFAYLPVHRLVAVATLEVMLDRMPDAAEREALVGLLNRTAPRAEVAVHSVGAGQQTRLTMRPAADAWRAAAVQMAEDPVALHPSGSRAHIEAIHTALSATGVSIAAQTLHDTTDLVSTDSFTGSFGPVTSTRTSQAYQPVLLHHRERQANHLVADFTHHGSVTFDSDFDGFPKGMVPWPFSSFWYGKGASVSITAKLGPLFRRAASSHKGGPQLQRLTWGIYNPKQGGCPLPDADVYNPNHQSVELGCFRGVGFRRTTCRAGDFRNKFGDLLVGGVGQDDSPLRLEDNSLRLSGWGSVEGRVLVIGGGGLPAPICAEIVRPATGFRHERTVMWANFSQQHNNTGVYGITGHLRLSQYDPASDTLIHVSLYSDTPLPDMSYHIAKRTVGSFGDAASCVADYRPARDMYNPFGGVVEDLKECLWKHPKDANAETDCPLGDLTPHLAVLETLPVHGVATHSFLDLAHTLPALRPVDPMQDGGWAVVLLSGNATVACAPLVSEGLSVAEEEQAATPPIVHTVDRNLSDTTSEEQTVVLLASILVAAIVVVLLLRVVIELSRLRKLQ
eukprot:TRINITY_DN708_c0_g1_i2.p1 TRINITY_DN708_c0_g1~~TRINITY_DN708_c0_g1_i2.p1  ORF type:complete len:1021 (+),score=137.46 TRINITY_DN708_c0_g1_i2:33-3065(+)